MDHVIEHIGIKRRSGRYPWGSGKDPEQRHKSFLGYVKKLEEEGLNQVEIAKGLGMSTTQLRARKSIAKAEIRAAMASQAQRLKEKGLSNIAIGQRMGIAESSVRSLLNKALQFKANIVVSTANMLRNMVEKKGLIDIGKGVESFLGISRTKLDTAVSLLKEEGYGVHFVEVEQLGTGKMTSIKVLGPPGMEYSEVYKNRFNIKPITDYSTDGGESYSSLEPIRSVSSKRIMIRYAEDGGADMDGVLQLRRGVEDISLGTARYAQVRVGVDDTHYMKGMAMYGDKLPPGVDIIYNTNKKKGTPPEAVFKSMKDDPDNPFGSVIRQKHYVDKHGKEQLSALNIVNEEGDWTKWSRTISSQILSKQTPALAKKQLDLAKDLKREEFEEIAALTNPTVKKVLLREFADKADADAGHLKAAALPRQANFAILPIPSMKETEVFAPNYRDGENVVLLRHPHGGTFEIPELRVNNRNATARSLLGKDPQDAIGIHPNVAKKLSGADFDGDTVLVIPNNRREIKTSPSLKGLADFDPKASYAPFDGMTTIDGGIYDASTGKVNYGSKKPNPAPKQMRMGDVSNLITDMTIKGATASEIARAVRHSMVVIDSEKHYLNYKQSAEDNGIAELKRKYQGGERAGAATLISRAGSQVRVPQRKDAYRIDPVTGKKIFTETGDTFVNRSGKVVKKTTKITRMEKEEDAFALSSGTKIETVYAEHANALKDLANRARLLLTKTPNLVYSRSARETYAPEVEVLKAKLREANKNRPRERQAQLLANKIVKAKKDANPDMTSSELRAIKAHALETARTRVGAEKKKIVITDREWLAIQSGAISNNALSQILLNTDPKTLRQRATPRTAYKMTDAKVARAKAMSSAGYTPAEIASALGVSTTTIQESIK